MENADSQNNDGSMAQHYSDKPASETPAEQCPLLWEEECARFVCHLCRKTFYNLTALQNHKNMTHDITESSSEGDMSCSSLKFDQDASGYCGFKFIPLTKGDPRDPSECELVPRVFTEDTSYLIVKVEGNDFDKSDSMKKSRLDAIIKKNQMKPLKTVDLRGPFTCTFPLTLRPEMLCRQIFFDCCQYSLHYREEHTKRRKAALRCQVCEKRLDRDCYLNINDSRPQPFTAPIGITFSCHFCGVQFKDRNKLDEHNRIVHAKTKPHQCSICSKRFTQQGGLQQHMRMHSGIRPFVCSYCPKAFTQKAGLDQHLRTHTKVKPFKCIICSKCFSQSVHLRQHMRTHTNIQPFECSVCGRRFKQSSHLNFHLRSHVMNGTRSSVVARFAQTAVPHPHMDFLNLSNLQPVQDGETLYFAAELAVSNHTPHANPFDYDHPAPFVPQNVLSL